MFAGTMLECPEEAWDKIFEINVKVSFLLFKECVPHMQVYSHVEQYYIWFIKILFYRKEVVVLQFSSALSVAFNQSLPWGHIQSARNKWSHGASQFRHTLSVVLVLV